MYLLIHLELALILLKSRPQNDEHESTLKYKAQLPQPCVRGCVSRCRGHENNDSSEGFPNGQQPKSI